MMKFLANENFPLKSINILRESGYDVTAIIEESPGISDEEVLTRAKNEKSMILTFDRDYGELIYKRKLPVPIGVVYFRFAPITPEEPAEYLIEILKISDLKLDSKFTILERGRVRQRCLPINGYSVL